MVCHYCGAETSANEIFCHCCGTRQEPPKLIWPEIVLKKEPEPLDLMLPAEPTPEAVEAEFPHISPVVLSPAIQLPVKRSLGKMFWLGLITLGIYPTVIWSRIVTELNIAASRYDGQRTMPYFGMILLAPLTLGIVPLVWMHRFCRRIGQELERRHTGYGFGPRHFWLWNVLGSFIIVGPFIFTHKLMKSMNLINGDFNTNG